MVLFSRISLCGMIFFFPCELVGMCVPYCFSGFCSARVSSVLEGGYRLLAVGGEGDD